MQQLAHLVRMHLHDVVQKSIKEMQGKVSLGSGEVPGLRTVWPLRCWAASRQDRQIPRRASSGTSREAEAADVVSNEGALLEAMEDILIMAKCQRLPRRGTCLFQNVVFALVDFRHGMGRCEATPSPIWRTGRQRSSSWRA